MNRLLLATTNPAKLEEYRHMLADSGLELVSLADLGIADVAQETGKTFEENAILKAKFYALKSNLPALADDGGLEITALGGQPGLHTKNLPDDEIVKDIFDRMKDVPEGHRDAVLTVALALATPYGIMTSYSSINGIIPQKPADKIIAGYPFRSVFYLPQYNKYHVDLTHEEDELTNHRLAALEKIKDIVHELSIEGNQPTPNA
jgi:XTP/dITP diphosphohydrolase